MQLIVLLIKQGNIYAIPESNFIAPQPFSNQALNMMVICFLAVLILSLVVFILKRSKRLNMANMIFLSVVFMIQITTTILLQSYQSSVTSFRENDVEYSLMPISLVDLALMHDNNSTAVVYIGRPTCPKCVYYEPYINYRVSKSNIQLMHYNTEEDRYDNIEELASVLNIFQVESVPIVIIVDKGDVVQSYVEDEILDNFHEIARYASITAINQQ